MIKKITKNIPIEAFPKLKARFKSRGRFFASVPQFTGG
jgi:hypothetical protein